LHLFVNMYSLHVLGPSVERVFAPGRMFVVYLLSGTAGVVTSLAFSQQPSVGASGAIFGLLGALGMFLFLHRHLLGRMAEMRLRQIVMVAVLNLGLGLMPGIDNWGHVGGLLAGMALAWLIGPRLEAVRVEANRVHLVDHRPWAQVWPKAFLAGGTIAVLAYAAISSPFSR
jgi:rhomboid protease GluP